MSEDYQDEDHLGAKWVLSEIKDNMKIERAWLEFLRPRNQRLLASVECALYVRSVGLLASSPRPKSEMQAVIRQMLLPNSEPSLEFPRWGLYSSRGECRISLCNFVRDCPRDPFIAFKVKESIVFSPSSFRLEHQKRKGMRWGRLYCNDFRLTQSFMAAEHDFPEDTSRETMFAYLLKQVESKGEQYNFAIDHDPLNAALVFASRKAQEIERRDYQI